MKDNKYTFRHSLSALAVSLALGTATLPSYSADASSGGIYGTAMSKSEVSIKNKKTGFTRTVTANVQGEFRFGNLPVGQYEITSGGQTKTIIVSVGSNTRANLKEENLLTVIGGQVSAIDTTSVESTTVFTQDQIQSMPIARSPINVALLAPGTVKGDSGFGNLASFGGASVAENGYFINGFDVTNIRNFVSFADLPFDAVEQQQIKTGGFGAEYGRSLGGVINIVTKSGSNEWEFGGAAYFEPNGLRERGTDVVTQAPITSSNIYSSYRSANTRESLSYNFSAGGPIIEDKLFFYGMYEGRSIHADSYGPDSSQDYINKSPMYLAKIDWNISDDHLLEYTYIFNENDDEYISFSNPVGQNYTGRHGNLGDKYKVRSGGDVNIARYTGFLTDDLTIAALYGKLTALDGARDSLPGSDCPLVFERLTNPSRSTAIGCWNSAAEQYYVPDATVGPDKDQRESIRLGAEFVYGDHLIRFGYDQEEFRSSHQGQTYTGGEYWRWHRGTGGTVNGEVVAEGDIYVRHVLRNSLSSEYLVENTAYYIEDSWQFNPDLMLYLGIRAEGFANYNGNGDKFVDVDNQIAPRLGFSWDMNGDGSSKLYGTLGRYYIPVASNTNIRASGAERTIEEYFLADLADQDPTTGAPTQLGAQLGGQNVNGSLISPDPRTIAATNLSPMYQDELILGYQTKIADWSVGVRYINREVKDGMDDLCSHQPFVNWASDNGYTNFDPDSMASCMLMNPGNNFGIALDLENNGEYTEVTIPNEYFSIGEFQMDKYKRRYDAFEVYWEKPMADGWFLQGSYTHAKSRGNIEGYVNSGLEQADAGLTQDLDNVLFQAGAYGPLPNDREHTVKLFGVKEMSDELSLSGNFLAQSGRPISCLGYLPLDTYQTELGVDAESFSSYGASSFFCQGQLGNRGDYGRTPWIFNFDLGVSYQPKWADNLTMKMDIFNLFNRQQVTEYSETGEIGSAAAPEANPDFLNAVNFQQPRSVRFSVRYNF
ncbi:TonB-dependent receptor [Pleionea sediminis]|uniref:TonB-dependent receptor n=1 Tax=Pleionea sediminis TaxID=2569479 RepID=UPI0011859E1F|nr:TonB-dependent receptor [Pleionea sediminis]